MKAADESKKEAVWKQYSKCALEASLWDGSPSPLMGEGVRG